MKNITAIIVTGLAAVILGITLATGVNGAKFYPTTFKCFNQDTYFCSLYWENSILIEHCQFWEMGCEYADAEWYCTVIDGNPFACPRNGSQSECVYHQLTCP